VCPYASSNRLAPCATVALQSAAAPLLSSSVPVVSLPGDHDYFGGVDAGDAAAYSARFTAPPVSTGPADAGEAACIAELAWASSQQWTAPSPGLYGGYVTGAFHVITLCVHGPCVSGVGASAAIDPEQRAWLEQELGCRVDRTVTPFLVVALHTPLYHSNAAHVVESDPALSALRAWLEPLLLRYGVDAVFAGHVHAFEITKPIVYGDVDYCEGIRWVTLGTGGCVLMRHWRLIKLHFVWLQRTHVCDLQSPCRRGSPTGPDNSWITPPPSWALFRDGTSNGYVVAYELNSSHFFVSMVRQGPGPGRGEGWLHFSTDSSCACVPLMCTSLHH
jgi:hypothetical protein